jgi:Superfamily II DNA and RNA helicases
LNFHEFGFDDDLLDGIYAMGYEKATPVQEQVIPPIIAGRDIIASAQTGTGKTAAFLLPVLHNLLTQPRDEKSINAMVIVPTRELAIQIAQTLEGLTYYTSISSIAVYGGTGGASFATEKKALATGVDIVICTPGRMIAHLNMGYVNVKQLKYLVLDEADRMLDMGFFDDIIKIISYLPKERQNLMFSATMPPKIKQLALRILQEPVGISIALNKAPEKIVQKAFLVHEQQKAPLIKYVLSQQQFESVIIFCSSKMNVKQLYAELKQAKFSTELIHSDLEQEKREQALLDFKNKKLKILVATDILSRGIDIEDIDLVINYDVPKDAEDYIHRIGRTARAASEGSAYTFVSGKEMGRFARIERTLGKQVPRGEVPEQFGPAPSFNARPEGRPGRNNGKPRRNGGGKPGGGHGRPGGNGKPDGNSNGQGNRNGAPQGHRKPKKKPSNNFNNNKSS